MVENRSSLIRLDDGQAVRLDDSGRSPAYFCLRKPVAVTRELIADLVAGRPPEIDLTPYRIDRF